MACVFCDKDNSLFENELAVCFFDTFPVNKGHLLIVPKRHVADYFGLSAEEKSAMDELLLKGKDHIIEAYSPDAFNIGVNCGEEAGQTIFHCHVHLIPRYQGDVEQPRGGVRGVIPAKQSY